MKFNHQGVKMQVLNKLGIDQAKRILVGMGSEIKMMRADQGDRAFMKQMDSDSAKLVLSYVQYLEDEIERRKKADKESVRMGNKFGVAVESLDRIRNTIKDLPDMDQAKKLSEIEDIAVRSFASMDKI
jgi:hypothetical protein